MNNSRRKQLSDLRIELGDIMSTLEDLKEEEQEYMDNMPENLWNSTRYDVAEEAVSNMEDALSSLEDVISSIEEAEA